MRIQNNKLFIVIVVLIAAVVICCVGGETESPARHSKKVGLYRASLDDNMVIDFTDVNTLGVFIEFHNYDFFRKLSLDMSVTVVDGNLYAVIYDVTDVPYTQQVSELKEVERMSMAENGSYNMDLKKLPANRQYAVGFFCDANCMFTVDSSFSWTTSKKDYIRDVWLTKLFKWEQIYTPKYYPQFEWNK